MGANDSRLAEGGRVSLDGARIWPNANSFV